MLLFALIAAAVHIEALFTIAMVNVLMWAMIAYETFVLPV